MVENIQLPIEDIRVFCRKWMIAEFSLFGSVLRPDFRSSSDINVLIELQPDAPWSLHEWVDMVDELKAIFGRNVDLVEKTAIRNPFRREHILNSARWSMPPDGNPARFRDMLMYAREFVDTVSMKKPPSPAPNSAADERAKPQGMAVGNNLSRRLFIALSSLLLALSAGCKKSNVITSAAVITSTGDYPSRDGKYIAHIAINNQNLITYSITSADGTRTLASGKAGNPAMKFFMCWDQSNNFFIDSEDTTRDLIFNHGSFESKDVTAKTYPTLPKPPAEFENSK